MILEQSPPESLQVFLLKAHRHNFGENRMLLKCQDVRYALLDVLEVAVLCCHHLIANASRKAGVFLMLRSPSPSCFSAIARMILIWNITHLTNTRIL